MYGRIVEQSGARQRKIQIVDIEGTKQNRMSNYNRRPRLATSGPFQLAAWGGLLFGSCGGTQTCEGTFGGEPAIAAGWELT